MMLKKKLKVQEDRKNQPKTEILSSKQLLRTAIKIGLEKIKKEDTIPKPLRIENPISVSNDLSTDLQTKVVSGFTPGAQYNILCLDTEGIYVHAVTEDRIKFVAYTKFTGELVQNVAQNRDYHSAVLKIIKAGNSIFLVPQNPKKFYRMEICPETGKLENQSEVILRASEADSEYKDLHLDHPRFDKSSIYCLVKAKSWWMDLPQHLSTLSTNGFSHFMLIPKISQFVGKVEEKLKNQLKSEDAPTRFSFLSSYYAWNILPPIRQIFNFKQARETQ